jgi:tetratricopeptide (TPR) repeat protein
MAWMDYSRGLCAAVLFVAVLVGAAPTHASLSDELARKIMEAQQAASQKDIGRAISLYNQAITEGIANPEANVRTLLKRRAQLFEQLSEYSAAETDLSAALNAEPKDTTAYADRGYFYMRMRRYSDALGDFISGARIDPRNPTFPFGAGRAENAMEHFARAVTFYNDAISLDPRNSTYILARAEAKLKLGQYAESRVDYDKAIAIGLSRDGDRFFAFAGRGYVNLVEKNYDAAIADLDRAIVINGTAADALMWRGYANEMRGFVGLALRDYERAAHIKPDLPVLKASIQRLRSN